MAPTQIPARSPLTKKAKTSEPGESSRAPRDSQSQSPPTRRPILASSPIEGNSDCRLRAFHDHYEEGASPGMLLVDVVLRANLFPLQHRVQR
ncbi:hypothetical protein CK203_048355 [Vitis vinifera]|uniref:Uncharacterized protein n=1 Tax=Vitis vinifera TaxID=29760 RepID=A0A438HRF1_VITVI|nr:hypothetical protein CK203_048355 [Vitis vinifera]